MRSTAALPVTVRRLSPPHDHTAELAADVRAGMSSSPKRIPSKYFYDEVGSRLFDDITRLPEYYLTRVETDILRRHADTIVAAADPVEVIELGSGASEKTRHLLDAMLRRQATGRYVPFDISEAAVTKAVGRLCDDYPLLAIDGLIGDYDVDLGQIPHQGRRLVTFLGSTIGNLIQDERRGFFRSIKVMLDREDRFLLGVDLVKSTPTMVAAYDDSAGVTAEFTLNILAVVNEQLGADFPVADFVHRPLWNPPYMEAWLEASRPMSVTIADLGLMVDIRQGERIHTEVSAKFTRSGLAAELRSAGLHIEEWFTDRRQWCAVALIKRT